MDIPDTFRFLTKLVRREISYHLIRPTHALLFITYRCSSRCRTCVMWRRGARDSEIPLEDWKRIVDECKKERLDNLEMFGGDALLRSDVLFPLIRYATDGGLQCDFVTNGILLNEEAARQLVLAGTSVVAISIDGAGETNDAIRGVPGAFDKALSALRNLRAARESLATERKGSRKRPKLVVNCTISRFNARKLDPLVDLLEKEKADLLALEYVGEIREPAIQASRVEGILPDPYFIVQEQSNYLSESDAEFLKEWIEEQHRTGKPRDVELNTENIDVLLPRHMSSGDLPWKSCYVCRTLLIVDPAGNVLCCPFFSTYHLGNVRRQSLSEIWGNHRHRLFIRAQAERKIAICTECILTLQRNPTMAEAIVKRFSQYWRRRKYKGRVTNINSGLSNGIHPPQDTC